MQGTPAKKHTHGWQASLALQFCHTPEKTLLYSAHHVGPLTVQRPFYPEGETCHLYLLHPPGGIVGGDTLDISVRLDAKSHALITMPGASKFYRSSGPQARLSQHFYLEEDSTLEWLPQDTIIFPGANAALRSVFHLKASSTLLAWELYCLGRPVIAETFSHGTLESRLEIWVEDEPRLIERQPYEAITMSAVAAAAGSFGQFLMVPVEGWLISSLGWQQALLALSLMVLLIVPLAFGLREPGFHASTPARRDQTIVQALGEAFRYPSFLLLTAGYFVCGFQVVFIGVHMPSYLRDHGLSPQVASYALALIGLFNVFGTYIAGTLGQRMPRRFILSFIYLARAVAISVFLLVPLSPLSVYIFSAVMGTLWLSTVPPTNATIAQIFGVQHLSMLGGFVFFSHQLGSFMGVWLGGYLYDATGSYDIVWYIAIGLGVLAGLVNLPIKEAPIQRAQPQAA